MAKSSREIAIEIANDPEFMPANFDGLPEFDAKDAPESAKWAIALGYVLHPSERARADVIQKQLPGVRIEADPEGRLVASYKGERGYINKPGASMQDFLTLAAEMVKFAPAAKFGAAGANATTQVVRAGVAAASTKLASDVAATPLGSKQGVDVPGAALTGAFAAGGQAVAPYIQKGLGWLSGKGVALWKQLRGAQLVAPTGEISARAAAVAREAGLDPNEITPQLAAQLEKAAGEALDSDLTGMTGDQLRGAVRNKALGERFGVPTTKGELTGDYAQQSLEENLRKMDVTTMAGRTMRAADDQSRAAMAGADGNTGAGMLRGEVAPRGAGLADQVEAGQAVVGATQRAGAAREAAYGAAYDAARETGAAVKGSSYRAFLGRAREAVVGNAEFDYNAQLMPKTTAMLEDLAKREVWFAETAGSSSRNIPLAKVESLRKTVNAAWKAADATDRLGLNELRAQLDDWIMQGIDDGSIVGDTGAVEAWKVARSLYSEFRNTFGPGRAKPGTPENAAGRTVETWLASDHVKGADAARQLLGSPALVRRMQNIFGPDSEVGDAMKVAALDHVLGPAIKNGGLQPQLAASRIDRFFFGPDREAIQLMFTKQELAAVREFRQLLQVKTPLPGVVNYSNSGNVVAKAMQQLFSMIGLVSGPQGAAITMGAAAATRLGRAGQASRAVAGLPSKQSPITAATAAAIASEISAERN